jgi:hypothetical protein
MRGVFGELLRCRVCLVLLAHRTMLARNLNMSGQSGLGAQFFFGNHLKIPEFKFEPRPKEI